MKNWMEDYGKPLAMAIAMWAVATVGVFYAAGAEAGEWWTDDAVTNTALVSANLLMAADWAQTREIADNPKWEEDWLEDEIGRNPTTGEVNRFFVQRLIWINAVGYFAPDKYKKYWYGFYFVVYGRAVKHNYELGIDFKF